MRYLFGCVLFGLVSIGMSPVGASKLPTVVIKPVLMPLTYQTDAVVEARQQATISAEITGKIEAVFFDVDDRVKQGEVVLRIRDLDYRARLEKARAALAEANANLQEMRLEYERSTDLQQRKLISQSSFDKTSASLKASQARLSSARADLAQAEEQLAHTVVRAPYSGVVVARHVEPGESIRPGEPFMTGYVPGQLRVNAYIPQSIIGNLRRGGQAQVLLLEDGSALAVEEITVHPFANPANHSFLVRFDLAALPEKLFPGMLVKVAIDIGSTTRLLLPREALVSRAEINAVYVEKEGGRLVLRQVRPGSRFGERIEILAGLEDGEIIVLDPIRAGIELKQQRDSSQ